MDKSQKRVLYYIGTPAPQSRSFLLFKFWAKVLKPAVLYKTYLSVCYSENPIEIQSVVLRGVHKK